MSSLATFGPVWAEEPTTKEEPAVEVIRIEEEANVQEIPPTEEAIIEEFLEAEPEKCGISLRGSGPGKESHPNLGLFEKHCTRVTVHAPDGSLISQRDTDCALKFIECANRP